MTEQSDSDVVSSWCLVFKSTQLYISPLQIQCIPLPYIGWLPDSVRPLMASRVKPRVQSPRFLTAICSGPLPWSYLVHYSALSHCVAIQPQIPHIARLNLIVTGKIPDLNPIFFNEEDKKNSGKHITTLYFPKKQKKMIFSLFRDHFCYFFTFFYILRWD